MDVWCSLGIREADRDDFDVIIAVHLDVVDQAIFVEDLATERHVLSDLIHGEVKLSGTHHLFLNRFGILFTFGGFPLWCFGGSLDFLVWRTYLNNADFILVAT